MTFHYLHSRPFVALLFILLSLVSCEKEDGAVPIINSKTELSFEFQRVNVGDDSFYKVSSSEVAGRGSAWIENGWGDGRVWLRKGIMFVPLITDTEVALEVTLWVQGGEENKDLLLLKDEELNYWERGWDYISTETEIQNLWNENKVLLDINNSTVMRNYSYELIKARKVFVQGVEKTYLEFTFSGEAYGIFGPDYPLYIIKNGRFKGVIE